MYRSVRRTPYSCVCVYRRSDVHECHGIDSKQTNRTLSGNLCIPIHIQRSLCVIVCMCSVSTTKANARFVDVSFQYKVNKINNEIDTRNESCFLQRQINSIHYDLMEREPNEPRERQLRNKSARGLFSNKWHDIHVRGLPKAPLTCTRLKWRILPVKL